MHKKLKTHKAYVHYHTITSIPHTSLHKIFQSIYQTIGSPSGHRQITTVYTIMLSPPKNIKRIRNKDWRPLPLVIKSPSPTVAPKSPVLPEPSPYKTSSVIYNLNTKAYPKYSKVTQGTQNSSLVRTKQILHNHSKPIKSHINLIPSKTILV